MNKSASTAYNTNFKSIKSLNFEVTYLKIEV